MSYEEKVYLRNYHWTKFRIYIAKAWKKRNYILYKEQYPIFSWMPACQKERVKYVIHNKAFNSWANFVLILVRKCLLIYLPWQRKEKKHTIAIKSWVTPLYTVIWNTKYMFLLYWILDKFFIIMTFVNIIQINSNDFCNKASTWSPIRINSNSYNTSTWKKIII